MLLGLDMVDEDMGEENIHDMLSDMFMWSTNSPRASPRRLEDEASREGSPARSAHLHAAGAYSRDDAHQPVGLDCLPTSYDQFIIREPCDHIHWLIGKLNSF